MTNYFHHRVYTFCVTYIFFLSTVYCIVCCIRVERHVDAMYNIKEVYICFSSSLNGSNWPRNMNRWDAAGSFSSIVLPAFTRQHVDTYEQLVLYSMISPRISRYRSVIPLSYEKKEEAISKSTIEFVFHLPRRQERSEQPNRWTIEECDYTSSIDDGRTSPISVAGTNLPSSRDALRTACAFSGRVRFECE
jgi:hypothetical protein